jgi:hypothetical protein
VPKWIYELQNVLDDGEGVDDATRRGRRSSSIGFLAARLRDEKEQRRLWQELVEPGGAAVRHPTIEDIVDTLVTEGVKKAVRL